MEGHAAAPNRASVTAVLHRGARRVVSNQHPASRDVAGPPATHVHAARLQRPLHLLDRWPRVVARRRVPLLRSHGDRDAPRHGMGDPEPFAPYSYRTDVGIPSGPRCRGRRLSDVGCADLFARPLECVVRPTGNDVHLRHGHGLGGRGGRRRRNCGARGFVDHSPSERWACSSWSPRSATR